MKPLFKRIITFVGLAVSTGAVVWIAFQFDLVVAWSSLGRARLDVVIVAAFVYTGLFALRGLRWSRLLLPIAPVRVTTATEVFLVGFVANNVLPARLGDVARGFVLARRASVPTIASLSTILLERVLDGLTVVFFLALALQAAPPSAGWVRSFQLMMTAAFVGAFGLCVALAVSRSRTLRLTERVLSFAPTRIRQAVQTLLVRIADGFMSLSSTRRLVEVGLLSLAVWATEVGVYVILAHAFGFDVPVFGLVVVMCVLTLGLTAPSAPAFVGVFEGLIISAIGLYGVAGSEALAFAVVVHVVHFLPGSVLGLWAAAKSGIELSTISQDAGLTAR